jgi:hypothetical protein
MSYEVPVNVYPYYRILKRNSSGQPPKLFWNMGVDLFTNIYPALGPLLLKKEIDPDNGWKRSPAQRPGGELP